MEKLLVAANSRNALGTSGEHQRFLADSFAVLLRVTTTSRLAYRPDCLAFEPAAEPIAQILAAPPVRETFEELCNQRAEALRRRLLGSECKYLNVMWSGGIDSTTALISILKTWPAQDLERVRVLLSSASIEEYPKFYRDTVLRRFRGRILNSALIPYSEFLTESLVVTGELGDQLFGSDLVGAAAAASGSEDAAVRDPRWQDLVLRVFGANLGGESRRAQRFFEVYEPIVRECPHRVDSFYLFAWWWNFTQKWQHVKFRIMLYMDEPLLAACRERLVHFFDCPRLQRWALEHPELKIKRTWESYKWTAKDLIVAYTGDEDYRGKRKHGSLKKIVFFHKPHSIVSAAHRFVADARHHVNPHFSYREESLDGYGNRATG